MQTQTKTSIGLADGSFFCFENPESHDFPIELIAHSLSKLCRFNGHCKRFYSVAEHSVLVSRILPPHLQLVGLLHDASEAYVGDMPSPLKRMIPQYKEIEERVQAAMAKRHGLPYPFPYEIHEADKAVYRAERSQIAGGEDNLWYTEFTDAKVTVTGMQPKDAEQFFLSTYRGLTNGKYRAAA